MSKIQGGCLCGNVRYSAEGEPVVTALCHCTHCQKQTGTAASVLIGVPDAALTLSGRLKSYKDVGGSGLPIYRKFCPDCGSPIVSVPDAAPGLTFIKAGTLDDTSWLSPTLEIWCRSAQPWVAPVTGAERYDKGRQ